MKTIEKSYSNYKHYVQLRGWILRHKPEYLCYLNQDVKNVKGIQHVASFSDEAKDWFVEKNMFGWLTDQIKERREIEKQLMLDKVNHIRERPNLNEK